MSRQLIAVPLIAAVAVLTWLWVSGGFDQLAAYAAGEQRAFQNEMAGTLRGLRAGDAGAFWLLISLCFAYGFFHAIGPGHGKVLIGGYGLGRQVPWLRLSVISVLASLGQAVTAIILVFGGIFLFQAGRQTLVGASDAMAPASFGAIALVGLWLVWRGLKAFIRKPHDHSHAHSHDDEVCGSCGHKHGPSVDEVSEAKSWREAATLIAGIAIRPCTGAVFLLLITYQMNLIAAGIAGTFAMAIGTASVVLVVGLAAKGLRGGLIGALAGSRALAVAMPMLELLVGSLVVVVASGLLLRSL